MRFEPLRSAQREAIAMRPQVKHRQLTAVTAVALASFLFANAPTAFGRSSGSSPPYWSAARILNLPPSIRNAIQNAPTACGRPLSARSSFDRYFQDRSGARFIMLNFQGLNCEHEALCN